MDFLFNSVPAVAQMQIAAIRPGMTRADVLEHFDTEGGIYSRFCRSYVLRGVSVPEQISGYEWNQPEVTKTMLVSRFVKIDVTFMPKEAHLQWVYGVGKLVDPQEIYRFDSSDEAADDIIVQLSPPYLGFSRAD